MSRKKKFRAIVLQPDVKYNDLEAAKFINHIMLSGKRSIAERIFYEAIDELNKRKSTKELEGFKKALKNVSPLLEVKSKRVGGATFQVPMDVSKKRKFALAARWILKAARSKGGKCFALRLADELTDAYNNEGAAVKKKDETHRMAEANKAFAHFK
eukprot:Anaeramoba_ignava/a484605_5.p1 GENE.a484605_5~~a484605_5.p1  ORF type:complete len:156 (+),score=22.49 a484605_5:166-633(+)